MKENDIGTNLKNIRKTLGITQEKFAEKLNVSRSCVKHWENNETVPNPYMIRKIKKTFNFSYEEIIDGI